MLFEYEEIVENVFYGDSSDESFYCTDSDSEKEDSWAADLENQEKATSSQASSATPAKTQIKTGELVEKRTSCVEHL